MTQLPSIDRLGGGVRRWWMTLGYHGVRWLPPVLLALLTYALFPVAQGFEVQVPEVGEVAPEEVLAPFEFDVIRSPEERDQQANALAATVRPLYVYRDGVVDSVIARVDRFFDGLQGIDTASALLEGARESGVNLTGAEAAYFLDPRVRRLHRNAVVRMANRYLPDGIADPGSLENDPHPELIVRRRDQERTLLRDSVLTETDVIARRQQEHPDSSSAVGDLIFLKLLNTFLEPTLELDEVETLARRADVRETIDSVKYTVQADERIINEHDIVTLAARERLFALQQELLRRGGLNEGSLRSVLGQVFTNGLLLAVFWLLLMVYLPDIYARQRQLVVLGVLFGVVVLVSAINYRFVHVGAELIPIPFAAVIISVLFGGRIAMVAAIVLAVLLGFQVAYGGQDAFYIALLGGVTGALSVRRIRRRKEIITAMALVTLAFVLASGTVALRVGWAPSDFGLSVFRGASNAVVSTAVVFLALPLFESWARATTDLTLLEMSDPNHPLLRRLATETPGTYAHSIAMANLCEGACNAIGANGLLARVGCYYHDVGKMQKPLHFAENQGPGGNPHDRLPPEVSASIIRNHVIDGLALADEHRLPEVLKDFIPEHHGTMEITYFLERARQRGPVSEEDLETYRYPGPRPRTAETAVAMLADGVEAALRVLEEPSPQRLRDAIAHVVRQRMDDGQLDEAPLTLAQLDRIKEEFVHMLSGMYHNRIDYPEEAGGITANWGAA